MPPYWTTEIFNENVMIYKITTLALTVENNTENSLGCSDVNELNTKPCTPPCWWYRPIYNVDTQQV